MLNIQFLPFGGLKEKMEYGEIHLNWILYLTAWPWVRP